MRISEFDYELPPEAIAQEPSREREASRLLVLERGEGTRHHVFRDLPGLLRPGDLLVVNRSRVFPARLLGARAGGGRAEVLLLRPLAGPEPDGAQRWSALVRPGRRLRPGTEIGVEGGLSVRVEGEPFADGSRAVLVRARQGSVAQAVERLGHMPLPPYIRRPDTARDRERYQTVFAREPGSVAAPTAGLHFSHELLQRLAAGGVACREILLHVGPATFQPVRAEEVEDHRLPPEPFVVPEETAAAVAATRQAGGRVVAVGTTTVRALESAAVDGTVKAMEGATDLAIVPGYRFRAVDALITNFHLPRSSLLLLVCAFAGREAVLEAYRQALALGYRFYSYGDAMLVL